MPRHMGIAHDDPTTNENKKLESIACKKPINPYYSNLALCFVNLTVELEHRKRGGENERNKKLLTLKTNNIYLLVTKNNFFLKRTKHFSSKQK